MLGFALLAYVAKTTDSPIRFRPVAKEEVHVLGQHVQAVQNFRAEREKLETTAGTPTKVSDPARAALPRSPIVAPAHLETHQAPPEGERS